ncbi:MAG: MoaD/ThiS family protein [Pseudomonadota bacterium]
MKVTLTSFANIRDITGSKQIELYLDPEATLAELFCYLEKTYGGNFNRQVRDQITGELVPFLILINEKAYRSMSDMDTLLHEADDITIMIPFDGG